MNNRLALHLSIYFLFLGLLVSPIKVPYAMSMGYVLGFFAGATYVWWRRYPGYYE